MNGHVICNHIRSNIKNFPNLDYNENFNNKNFRPFYLQLALIPFRIALLRFDTTTIHTPMLQPCNCLNTSWNSFFLKYWIKKHSWKCWKNCTDHSCGLSSYLRYLRHHWNFIWSPPGNYLWFKSFEQQIAIKFNPSFWRFALKMQVFDSQ